MIVLIEVFLKGERDYFISEHLSVGQHPPANGDIKEASPFQEIDCVLVESIVVHRRFYIVVSYNKFVCDV